MRKGRCFQGGYNSIVKTSAKRNIYENQSISKNILIQFAAQYN